MCGVRIALGQRLPKSQRPVTGGQPGADCQPPTSQPHEQLSPACLRFPIAILDSDQLFVPMLGHPDDNQQTHTVIHAHVAVYPIDPPVDVTALAKVSLAPRLVLVTPTLLESADGVGREPLGLVTQERTERVLLIPGGNAFEVEPRQQGLYAPGPLEIGRQQGAGKVDTTCVFPRMAIAQ